MAPATDDAVDSTAGRRIERPLPAAGLLKK
jgi:hypothetical protein